MKAIDTNDVDFYKENLLEFITREKKNLRFMFDNHRLYTTGENVRIYSNVVILIRF